MGRRTLPLNYGMLFVFERPERQCFWMRNTPLPLTIAFIGDDGAIVNFADMEPFSEQAHCSEKPVRYAWKWNGAGSGLVVLSPETRSPDLP